MNITNFAISTNYLSEDELLSLIKTSVHVRSGEINLTKASKRFWDSLDTVIIASFITGGAAIITSFISGIFLILSKIADKKEKHPQIIIQTSKRYLNIDCEEDLPDEKEISKDQIIEIQLLLK